MEISLSFSSGSHALSCISCNFAFFSCCFPVNVTLNPRLACLFIPVRLLHRLVQMPGAHIWRHLILPRPIVDAQWRTSMTRATRTRRTSAAIAPVDVVAEYVMLPGMAPFNAVARQLWLHLPIPHLGNGGEDGVAFGDERWIMYLQRSFSSRRSCHRMGSRTSMPRCPASRMLVTSVPRPS